MDKGSVCGQGLPEEEVGWRPNGWTAGGAEAGADGDFVTVAPGVLTAAA